MPWIPVAFEVPPSTTTIAGSAATALAAAPGAITAALGRLAAVPLPSYAANPAAAPAAAAGNLVGQLAALLDSDVHILVVHPWQQGVGDGQGVYRNLSAPNALQALRQKILAGDEPLPTGTVEGLALLIAAHDYQDLATQLAQFTAALPLPEWQMVQRRAAALVTWEDEKIKLGAPLLTARTLRRKQAHIATLGGALGTVHNRLALVAGAASEAAGPAADLQALAAIKQATFTTQAAAIAALGTTFTGGAGLALAMGNTLSDIAGQIISNGGPGHDYTVCTACLFLAPPGQMTALKQVVGV